jgi:uncharacterized membrane protein YjjP (DUF1212 family)
MTVEDDPKAVFIVAMARELHRAGVATDALENAVEAVARSIELPIQVFALPTYVTIAIGPENRQHVVMLRMEPARVKLRSISMLNDIYDELNAGKIDYRQAAAFLREMEERKHSYSPWLRIPALAMAAVGVAILLGAGSRELIVAALIGGITGAISAIGMRVPLVSRLFAVIVAFAGALIVAGFTRVAGPVNIYISIVAGVVVVLPGYSLTLALHELANDDLVAGTARLGKVLSVLFSLGCGALLGFAVCGPQLLASGGILPHPVGAIGWIPAVVLLALGFSIALDARPRDFFWVLAASFVAILASKLAAASSLHEIGPFISALVCGVVANVGARFLRVPQPVMLVPALYVLVPGSLSYESILFAFNRNINAALPLAVNAAAAAVLLVAGLLLSQLLFPSTPLRALVRPRRYV